MSIFEMLKKIEGPLTSSHSKEFASQVLEGDHQILDEAVELVVYDLKNKKEKNIRVRAAKLVECVAMEKAELVTPYLKKILPALEAPEPQTRWMILRIMGFCAANDPDTAKEALPFARDAIRQKKDGQLCLVSSADLYLGDYGALSVERAREVYKLLLESTDNLILNEHDWLLEAFMKIIPHLNAEEKKVILDFAAGYQDHERKSTRERVKALQKMCE